MKTIHALLEKNENILCLLAIYEANLGNCTQVITDSSNIVLSQSISSVLYAIGDYFSLDLKTLRRKQQLLLNCKYYVPLPMSKNLLLIPIKTRTPLVEKDPTHSYINYYAIEKLDTKKPIIHLRNHGHIESLNKMTTIKKRHHQATISAKLYTLQNHLRESPENTSSRSELESLRKEIHAIKGILLERKHF